VSTSVPEQTPNQQPVPLASRPTGISLIAAYFGVGGVGLILLLVLISANIIEDNAAFGALGRVAAIYGAVLGSALLVTSIGLLRRAPWARWAGVVLGLLSFSTLIGLVIAYYLARGESARYFTKQR
jgi:hypothetical protein